MKKKTPIILLGFTSERLVHRARQLTPMRRKSCRVHCGVFTGFSDELASSRHLLMYVGSISPRALQVCRILTLPPAGGLFMALFTEFPKYVYSVSSIPTALTPLCGPGTATSVVFAGAKGPEKSKHRLFLCPVLPTGMPLTGTSCQLEFRVLRFSERGPQASSISITWWNVIENSFMGPT